MKIGLKITKKKKFIKLKTRNKFQNNLKMNHKTIKGLNNLILMHKDPPLYKHD